MVILVAMPAYILLHHSRWGRYLFAVGSNSEAARLSRRQRRRARSIWPTSCRPRWRAFAGVLPASRIAIGIATRARAGSCSRSPPR